MNVYDIDSKRMLVHNEKVIITKDTILKTIEHFIKNQEGCIAEAVSGEVFVNDLDKYVAQCEERINDYQSGNFNVWLGFWQQAYYIQSGKCVGILG